MDRDTFDGTIRAFKLDHEGVSQVVRDLAQQASS